MNTLPSTSKANWRELYRAAILGLDSTKLPQHIVEAEKAGCYKVLLACFPDRVPFYERLGFRLYEEGMRLDLPRGTKNPARLGSALGVRS